MRQRDDYEFKAMLSELSIVDRGSMFGEVARRKTGRRVRRGARYVAQRAERTFSEALADFIIIIGGLADPVINLTRGLTIWSLLVLGAGASSLVLIRAYMGGLLGEQLLLAGVFTTLLICLLIGLRVTTAARRGQIEIMRMQVPEWLSE